MNTQPEYITIKGEQCSTALTAELHMNEWNITDEDIMPLKRLTNLTITDLGHNPIIGWSPVAHVEVVTGRPEPRR